MIVHPNEADVAVLHATLAVVEAEREALIETLRRMLAMNRSIEFRTPADQALLRGARVLLDECDATSREALRVVREQTVAYVVARKGDPSP